MQIVALSRNFSLCTLVFIDILNCKSTCGSLRSQEVVEVASDNRSLVDVPKQNKAEAIEAFVMRVCVAIHKTEGVNAKWNKKTKDIEDIRRTNAERLFGQFTS